MKVFLRNVKKEKAQSFPYTAIANCLLKPIEKNAAAKIF